MTFEIGKVYAYSPDGITVIHLYEYLGPSNYPYFPGVELGFWRRFPHGKVKFIMSCANYVAYNPSGSWDIET